MENRIIGLTDLYSLVYLKNISLAPALQGLPAMFAPRIHSIGSNN